MQIELDLKKNIDQNASEYFERAKKLKKKMEGIRNTIEEYEQKLKQEEAKEVKERVKQEKVQTKKEWFEKFRWFYSSDGFLVIGGRDATTNDILVKKHMEKNDLIFHTEIAGSPFVIIKNDEQKEIPQTTKQEAADFCASYSKAWKRGVGSTEVYAITSEQVSKEAVSGEYLSKGSFMIYGKRTYFIGKMNVGLCLLNGKIMAGPLDAIKQKGAFVVITQGNGKLSEMAKKIQRKIGGEIDEIVRALPSGSELKK